MDNKKLIKLSYAAPKLEVYGGMVSLTAAGSMGAKEGSSGATADMMA